MVTPVAPQSERFEQGVADFFSSFEWVYLTHYFPAQAQGVLLRLLTLSGLDSWCWKRYAMHLVPLVQPHHPVVKLLMREDEAWDQVQLKEAVEQIWEYAAAEAALVEEPAFSPTYLTAYGYTQEAYLTDLHLVYGRLPDDRYETPWPATVFLPAQSQRQMSFAHKAVALMGATAGAIAQLVKGGMVDGDNR